MVLEVTDSTLEEVLKTDKLVIIDFWAEWCGPCRVYGPILTLFSEENPDIIVGKINVDESSESAAFYGIRSIPTTIVFRNGEVINRMSGILQKEKLAEIAKL